jgi:hypothetical protein
MQGHSAKVGALTWHEGVMSSGSRHRLILHDVRTPNPAFEGLVGRQKEVSRKRIVNCQHTLAQLTALIKILFVDISPQWFSCSQLSYLPLDNACSLRNCPLCNLTSSVES